jgi:hypothetical protein
MRARLVTNLMLGGHVARDFINLAAAKPHAISPDIPPKEPAAHDILDFFEDRDTPFLDEAVPIRKLVRVLTESLNGTPPADDAGRTIGARLFRGCKVRLRGIPDRLFIIRDIYWDYGEVKVKEIGSDTSYLVPWDCLKIVTEQEG